jgi:hypothetical protein
MPELKFPTEVVNLPSKGHYYSKDDPLASGEIEIKYMTAKEEDILTSQNLIRRGIVIDKLLEALVVDEKVNLNTMLIGDKNAIMIASRILGYGKNYDFEVDCPACAEHNKDSVDLTTFPDKKIDFSKHDKGQNEFTFKLPATKVELTFKILTQKDERDIDDELKAMKKITKGTGIDPEVTTRMKKLILAVDGERSRAKVNKFIDEQFLSRDSLEFRKYLQTITPDIDMTYNFECSLCTYIEEMTVPMTVQFLWPAARV